MATPLIVKLELDAEDLQKGIITAKNQVASFGKEAGGAGGQAENLSGSLLKANLQFAAITAAAYKAWDVTRDVVGAALQQEQAENDLAAAMRARGTLTDESIDQAIRFADSLQMVTKFQDDEILSAQRLLVSLAGLSGEGLQEATRAAADLAAGLGVDLATASRMVAQTVSGSSEALKRYGIDVADAATSGERLDLVQQAIQQRFGGAAEAQMEGFSGAVKQLNDSWNEFKESAGKAVTSSSLLEDTLRGLAKVMDTISGRKQGTELERMNDELVDMLSKLHELRAGKGPEHWFGGAAARDAIKTYERMIDETREKIGKLRREQEAHQIQMDEMQQRQDFKARQSMTAEDRIGLLGGYKGPEEQYGPLTAEQQAEKEKNAHIAAIDAIQTKRTEALEQRRLQLEASWQMENDFLLRLQESYAVYGITTQDLLYSTWDTVAGAGVRAFQQIEQAASQALFNAVTGAENTKKVWEGLRDALIKTMIDALVRIAAQYLIWAALQRSTVAAMGAAEYGKEAGLTYFRAFNAVVGIPIIGPAIAPGIAAASTAAAIAGATASKATGMGVGMAYETGTDFVPMTAPALIHKGERVVQAEANQDLTDFLHRQESLAGTGVTVNISIEGGFFGSEEAIDRLAEKVGDAVALRRIRFA